MNTPLHIIVSGGGTGGHIFPAISIANALRTLRPDAEILFVGALGRMEMQRVPAAGYRIVGLPVAGFNRKNPLRNIPVLFKLLKSQWKARKIIRQFRPDVAVGVGGYASGPTLRAAAKAGIPTLIQEQNSYAGVTNKLLAKGARLICVAYDGMERFFPAEKIVKTGNPVRQSLLTPSATQAEAVTRFGLNPQRKTILIIGGSLGARTLNESVLTHLADIAEAQHAQVIWQTGNYYSAEISSRLACAPAPKNLAVLPFIDDMALAYAAADLVISRAGAGSISELCLLGKPAILVPSPNVAEDHQTKNARALSDKDAALFVRDADAAAHLLPLALETVADAPLLKALSTEVKKLALPDSALLIAQHVLRLAEEGKR